MNYSNIISDFTWSYSRLTAFEHCPYKFFLSYIKPHSERPLFFSDYGTFLHKIIEMRLNGKLRQDELVTFYLTNFRKEVIGAAPNRDIFNSYFEQGLNYLKNMDFPYPTPNAVEHRVDFFTCKNHGTAVEPEEVNAWDLRIFFPGLSDKELYSMMNDPSFWENVTPKDGAQKYLKQIIDDGHRFL